MSISELCYKHDYLATLPRGGPQERTCTKRERHSPPQHVSCDGHDGGFDIMAHNRRRNVVISASPSTGCRSCSVVTVGNHAANSCYLSTVIGCRAGGLSGSMVDRKNITQARTDLAFWFSACASCSSQIRRCHEAGRAA